MLVTPFRWVAKKQSIFGYLLILILFFLLGFIIRYIISDIIFSISDFCGYKDLMTIYEHYVAVDLTRIQNEFWNILIRNIITVLTYLIIPSLIIVIIFLDRNNKIILSKISNFLYFKGLIYLSFIILSFHTFEPFYCPFKFIPTSILIAFQYHALAELPTFFIAGLVAIETIDNIPNELNKYPKLDIHNLKSILKGIQPKIVWVIVVLMIIIFCAAYFESHISPLIAKQTFEDYLRIYGIV